MLRLLLQMAVAVVGTVVAICGPRKDCQKLVQPERRIRETLFQYEGGAYASALAPGVTTHDNLVKIVPRDIVFESLGQDRESRSQI